MRRVITIIVIIVGLAVAGFIVVRQRQQSQNQEIEILREALVRVGTITRTVNATGSIEPEALVTLSFGQGGTIRELNVTRGQTVSKGDWLAQRLGKLRQPNRR